MAKKHRTKFVFSITIPPDLARKLRTVGGRNFTRNIGALFEVLDEAGFFERMVELQQRSAEATAQAVELAQQRARHEWLEALKPFLIAPPAQSSETE